MDWKDIDKYGTEEEKNILREALERTNLTNQEIKDSLEKVKNAIETKLELLNKYSNPLTDAARKGYEDLLNDLTALINKHLDDM